MHPGAAHAGIDWTPWHIALVVFAIASFVASAIGVGRLMRYFAFNYPKRYPRSLAVQMALNRLEGTLWGLMILFVLWLFW